MAELQKCFKACSLLSVSLVALMLWLSITTKPSMAATQIPVGIILDLNSTLGRLANNSLTLAVENSCPYHQVTAIKINLIVRDISRNDVLAAAKAASDLILEDKVRAILGPQNSEQARFIVKLGEKYQVPVIWFPITGPSLLPPPSPSSISSDQGLKYCFQFRAIADTIEALGWQSIVPIYEDTEDGSHLVPCLSNVLKEKGIQMVNVTAIDSDTKINSTLDELNKMRVHLYLVHMSMDFGTRFIKWAEDRHMMDEGYAWILTQELSSLTDPQASPGKPLKGFMQGALGIRPMESNKTWFRRNSESCFKLGFNSSLTIYGWWAYHTVEALATALEKLGTENNGKKLGKEIWATNFTGRSSGHSGLNFSLSKGQLDQSVFEVYNVIGTRERIIGSWSPGTGLVKTSGDSQLKDPLWPGDTLDKPPKLRIGVPRTNFSPEFVNVDIYNSSKPLIYGFAITVFLKAVDVLPFPLKNYDFVPLPNQSRSDPMTYDDLLCKQMKDENLDAIIGDITIVENRTNCVDFTLPYLESSVAMLVTVKTASTSKMILFKPFHWLLWLNLSGIFVAATIIIIILERFKTSEITEEARLTEKDRLTTKEVRQVRLNPFLVYKIDVLDKLESRAAGWLVILTSFLFILILQVYTANLTSILMQGKTKEPSFKDENEIKSNNRCVGYRTGSWVRGLLIDQIGFSSSQLKALGSREEYSKALSNGTVVAIFDETPYLTRFLSKYKSHFMMTGPIYKTGGFAFAFPKKYGLASHFSTAILKVTRDAEAYRVLMAKSSLPISIEDLKFEDENEIETSSLSINNFGGVRRVVISVVALFLCLIFPLVIKKFPNPSSLIGWVRRVVRKLPFKLAS
ncbi:hypothetical protein K1719_012943 [Acacia pycnantha]|nr:hypothetical protein K1719_012943 [Acacia pycnantha]